MCKRIFLHDESVMNSEGATATVSYDNRSMSMIIEANSHGFHKTSFAVYFDSSKQMRDLANALLVIACEAEDDFAESL